VDFGTSPRAGRNLDHTAWLRKRRGNIPARGEEPARLVRSSVAGREHPRARGGTAYDRGALEQQAGTSTRAGRNQASEWGMRERAQNIHARGEELALALVCWWACWEHPCAQGGTGEEPRW